MKTKLLFSLFVSAAASHGAGLYLPNDHEGSVPISWSVGIAAIWDDNTNPGGPGDGDETFSINPYVSASLVRVNPQTTLDLYARLGLIYYFDEPVDPGSDDLYTQARIQGTLVHNLNERLRFTSVNYLSRELEPDYSYGFASGRSGSDYLFYQTDNSIGYRWSERIGTYSGFILNGVDFDDSSENDRFTWSIYNQFRYQFTPQTVLTGTHRYAKTQGSGIAIDSMNHYFLGGVEHRFNQNTGGTLNAGIQLREKEGLSGLDSSNPYVEAALTTHVNQQFNVSAFARYGSEDYDTVVITSLLTEYDDRLTLRVGVKGDYQVSPTLLVFGGLNIVNASYESGRFAGTTISTGDSSEKVINASVGASLNFTDNVRGTVSYDYTNSDSDLLFRGYTRNRISVGVSAEF